MPTFVSGWYLVRAADHAVRSLAYEEAARLYARAADLPPTDARRPHELLLAAARNRMFAGDFARARELYERLAGSEDPDAALRAAIGYEEASWRPGIHGERAVTLIGQALARREPDPDDRVYVRALANLGRALSFIGAERPAREVGDRALDLAHRIGDDELVGNALRGLLWRGMNLELASALLAHAVELTGLGTTTGDLELIVPGAFFRSLYGYMLGRADDWTAGHNDLVRASRSGGQPFYRYMAACSEYGRSTRAATSLPWAEPRLHSTRSAASSAPMRPRVPTVCRCSCCSARTGSSNGSGH